MFMLSRKRKKTIAIVVSVVLSLMFMLSVVSGYFSSAGYLYNFNSLPGSSAAPAAPAPAQTSPLIPTTQGTQTTPTTSVVPTVPAHAIPQK